jgi:hypothetical protein
MSGSVEASRRHRRFDLRWPRRRVRGAADRPAVLTSLEDVPDGLDWDAFSTRCFPGRGRHDLEAISAYDAYHARPTAEEPAPAVQEAEHRAKRDNPAAGAAE